MHFLIQINFTHLSAVFSLLGVTLSNPISERTFNASKAAFSCEASVVGPSPWQTCGGVVLRDTNVRNISWFALGKSENWTCKPNNCVKYNSWSFARTLWVTWGVFLFAWFGFLVSAELVPDAADTISEFILVLL